MNKFMRLCLSVGCLAVLVLSQFVPWDSAVSNEEANLPRNSGADILRGVIPIEDRGHRVQGRALARASGEQVPVAGGRFESSEALSRYEKLLTALDAISEKAELNLEQIRSILEVEIQELNATERGVILTRVARLVAERNLDMGLDLVGSIESVRDQHGFVRVIVEAVVEGDPSRAVGWASRLPDAQLVQSAFNIIGMKWGQLDLEACRVWAEAVPEMSGRVRALEGLAWAWTLKDPNGAYDWAARLPESEMREKIFVKMAKMVAASDPQRGSEWALRFPEGPGRAEALSYAVFQWAGRDLDAAARWVSQIGDQALHQTLYGAVAGSWSNRDPASATVWAAQLPEGPARTSALLTTARKWAGVNPVAAAQWIEELGQTQAREDLVKGVVGGLAMAEPTAAETWLNCFVDAKLRAAGQQILAVPD